MSKQRPPLDPTAFRAVCAYAVAHAILPDDVIRVAARLRPREPFLINVRRLDRHLSHGRRFLSILAELHRGDSKLFETAAPKIRGTVRTYFGHTVEEVESTGSSNYATQIPDSPWFVTVNNSEVKRTQIVSAVMHYMGFSSAYAAMISRLCTDHEARLPSIYISTLARISNA